MRTRDIKTIAVNCKEWFDKVNGNSYFAGEIIVNAGKKNEKQIKIPFQYGYGDFYRYKAFETIKKELNYFKKVDERTSYWSAYNQYKIKATHHIKTNCLKRELLNY